MKLIIERYSKNKNLIAIGDLSVINELDKKFKLIYRDSKVNIESIESDYPLLALEDLRLQLEEKFSSLINCSGCRKDVSYRPTGGMGSYIIEMGKPATKRINLFEPTKQIELLCTVDEQKKYYTEWIDNFE